MNSQNQKSKVFVPKPAGIWPRLFASLIDSMVLSVPVLIISLIMIVITEGGLNLTSLDVEHNMIISKLVAVISFCYFVYLTYAKGTTVGKDAYGLKVFKMDTEQKVDLKQSAVRELVKSGPLVIPVIGTIFFLVNGLILWLSKSKMGIHDRVANTQVMKVQKAWPMSKQLVVFGGYILLLAAYVAAMNNIR